MRYNEKAKIGNVFWVKERFLVINKNFSRTDDWKHEIWADEYKLNRYLLNSITGVDSVLTKRWSMVTRQHHSER